MKRTKLQAWIAEMAARETDYLGVAQFDYRDDRVMRSLLTRLVLTAMLDEIRCADTDTRGREYHVTCCDGMVHTGAAPGPDSLDLLRQVMDRDCDGRPHTVDVQPAAVIDKANLDDQRAWSLEAFGPNEHTAQLIGHIESELLEIADAPEDVSEWVDVVIIALDGAMRAGHTSQEVIDALVAKQALNRRRRWADWRTASEGEIPHHLDDDHVDEVLVASSNRDALSQELLSHGWYVVLATSDWQILSSADDECHLQTWPNGRAGLSIGEGEPPVWFPPSCPDSVILASALAAATQETP